MTYLGTCEDSQYENAGRDGFQSLSTAGASAQIV